MFDVFSVIAITAATAGGFVFGAVWYGVLGKIWMQAANLSEAEMKPKASTMIIGFICQAVITLTMAGVMWHTAATGIRAGIITAAFIWVGFIVTTMIVNHRFQGQKWALTFVDGGHWLGVLLIQGGLLGALSD